MTRLDEIRERHAARLRTRAAKGDGAVQMSTLVDDDVAWLLDLVGRQHDQFLELNKVIDDQQERIDDLNDEIANCEVLKYKAQVEHVEALASAAEKRSPIGAAYDRAHPGETASVLIPVRDLRAALDTSGAEESP